MSKIILSFLIILLNFNLGYSDIVKDSTNIDIHFYQNIPTRDGIQLSANIYKPSNLTEPLPVILIITPYITDKNHERGLFFARNNYIFISVDSRGRGNSEGSFIPFENDGKDGYDIIKWISNQSWCDGKIGMFGGSYRGMNQWLTLKEFPTNLKTIIPIASVGPGLDFPKYQNIYYPYDMRWLMLTSGKTSNIKLFGYNYWESKNKTLYQNHIPFSKFDSIIGFPSSIFQKWIKHPTFDSYWKSILLSDNDYKKIDIPILTITGHFDGDQIGAMHYYNQHMKFGSENAKKNHYFISGPWGHGGTRRPKTQIEGLVFKDNAVIYMNQLYLDWFNWTLKNKKKPKILEKRVMYYSMGANKWAYANKLEDCSDSILTLYLNSLNTEAKDVFHSGSLKATPSLKDISPDIIVYNPLANDGIKSLEYSSDIRDYYTNQYYVSDKNILFFHSDVFEQEIEINGKIELTAYISIDAPDADFIVNFYEITSKNESIFLQTEILRARYRNSLEEEILIKPNKIEKYIFKGRNLFFRRLQKGSRIRMTFSPLDIPDRQKNYNSGKDVSFESEKDAKITTIKLYHNKKYPSLLKIPIKSNIK